MECYILNNGCGTSSVKALFSICYFVDVVLFHSLERTITMISLTADELPVQFSISNSIRGKALRFFF